MSADTVRLLVDVVRRITLVTADISETLWLLHEMSIVISRENFSSLLSACGYIEHYTYFPRDII